MFGDGDPRRLALRPGYPSPVQPVGRNGKHKERIPLDMWVIRQAG